MKNLATRFLLLGVIAAPTLAYTNDITSQSATMSFNECLNTIRGLASDTGTAPINIAETNTVRVVRFPASDGSILVTCSKLDNQMTITRNQN